MRLIPWPELKPLLLALPKGNDEMRISVFEVIVDEELYVKSHIATIDQYPNKPNLSNREKDARLFIAKPHYDRMMAYYFLKTQL